MVDRYTNAPANQIKDRTLKQLELDITNTPSDGQILKVNMPTGDFTAIDAPDVVDLAASVAVNQANIVLNAFRIAIDASRSIFNMVDGIVDYFNDETGIDTANSVNEDYDAANDLYSPSTTDSIDTSPFAHMKLQNNTDDGTGANIVTDIGTPTYTAGKINDALTLDGSTDALNVDALQTDISSDTTGSISVWFKATSLASVGYVVAFSDAINNELIRIRVETSGLLRVSENINALSPWEHQSAGSISTGIWYHIVVVQDGVSPKIYLDGIDITNLTSTSDTTVWFNDATGIDNGRIGCVNFNSGGNSSFWNGQIDDFRYYQNTVLTQSDVDLLYNSGAGTEDDQPSSGSGNMTLISDTFTAEVEPDDARIVVLLEDVDAVTINTDLKVYITRDAGQTFTTDFSTDDKLDITSHGFLNDDRIIVTSSSQDLPTGLDSATVYYVVNKTTNDFELSLTSSGSAVDITDNGTGTHTAKKVNVTTLSDDGNFDSSKRILTGSVDISDQPSGTSMEYVIATANTKDLKIHSSALNWE